ncbi:type I-E CRISPR-associated protein Cse1/CasA [Streptomyces sp. BBFR2]|uniref:type I-E CRISPR-associated protein Cse1/CasA n=1 Tax=Streptomyces sp. BBFR2 TaxID=3372854 RepID=UPI0037DA3DDF
MEGRPTWDPRRQPCVTVITLRGEREELSLLDVLSRAEELSAVFCSTPGETVAVTEYLLAICFAAGVFPASVEEWRASVAEERGLGKAAEWLAGCPDDEWDLFHPERPLGQNSLLASLMDEHGAGPAQLVMERVGDYSQFFDHHHLERFEPLPAAEAFRALLTQHVYGLAGRARLSGKELGPKLTNLSAGRLQGRIRVVVQGRTVGDTLRMNLYPPAGGRAGRFNRTWTSAGVERRKFDTRPPGRATSGPADLHSYLGRSVLLRPGPVAENGEVTVDRVLVGAGELLALDPERDLEDAVLLKQLNGHRKPLWPSPSRALWRDAHALYSAAAKEESGLFGRLRHLTFPPTGGGPPCVLWAVGLIANKTLATRWTDGAFPYAPSMGEELCVASRRGSAIAEYVARALERAAYVCWKVIYPNPKPADRPAQQARFDARREFWPAAEEPFLQLLEATSCGDPVPLSLLDYAGELRPMAEDFLRNRLDSLQRNEQGLRARARAEMRFHADMASPKAPPELRGEVNA